MLRLLCRDPAALAGGARELVAPNGTRIELRPGPAARPAAAPAVVRADPEPRRAWADGRAGMRYRDLIPDRQGGRFIASHIRIPEGGPVPDYVHYHRVRFQMIYCRRGWVRVVYEDQGPPFVMQAGDCVLQPPGIRHRVLECSPGLEVIEVTCPAEHETLADHDLALPTTTPRPDRDFDGQRFVRHEAARASFAPWGASGFEARDLGIEAATAGLATAHVMRRSRAAESEDETHAAHDAALLFSFVLSGAATVHCAGEDFGLVLAGDAFVIPPHRPYDLRRTSADFDGSSVSVVS